MSWYLVDDNLTENPKVLKLLQEPNGFAALGLWTLCGAWSRKYRTSGAVSAAAADASARKSGHNADASALAQALVDAELWERTADGFQFVNWNDIYSEEDKSAKRKEKDRERKRRKRDGKKADNTADASADIPPEIRGTPGSSPSPSPSPIPLATQEGKTAHGAPPLDTDFTSGGYYQTFRDTFAAEASRMGFKAPPEPTPSQLRSGAKRAGAYARATKIPFDQACIELSRTALEAQRATGKDAGLHLLSIEPGQPLALRQTGLRPARAAPTTGKDFENAEPFELQLERIGR